MRKEYNCFYTVPSPSLSSALETLGVNPLSNLAVMGTLVNSLAVPDVLSGEHGVFVSGGHSGFGGELEVLELSVSEGLWEWM
jgi:hypothetical protein